MAPLEPHPGPRGLLLGCPHASAANKVRKRQLPVDTVTAAMPGQDPERGYFASPNPPQARSAHTSMAS